MGYVIAAYTVVLGTLVVYGLWVHAQRRSLMRQTEAQGKAERAEGRLR
ncbi:MAG: hypothetical protein QNK04_18515 [Myxococcota bacterium]|nr:hypothetical protein [Myxococcota bacterium]